MTVHSDEQPESGTHLGCALCEQSLVFPSGPSNGPSSELVSQPLFQPHSRPPSPPISKKAAFEVLALDAAQLYASATRIRQKNFGDVIHLCAIINAKSGNCGMDCSFCSQSAHNSTAIQTFPFLDASTLHKRIQELRDFPLQNCGIVTSGGALDAADIAQLTDIFCVESVHTRPKLCASLGRLDSLDLAALHAAGMHRYHHNLETSEAHYPRLCTTQRWHDRLATVRAAQALGIEVCCGGLFGTGESWNDRIDFALQLAQEGICSIPINFLYPHPGTPLGNRALLEADEALRIIALFRHILPWATLRICGGRAAVLGTRQEELFAAGANALMTGNYLTTAGESIQADLDMIARLGLTVAS